jgi:hypothetical protein
MKRGCVNHCLISFTGLSDLLGLVFISVTETLSVIYARDIDSHCCATLVGEIPTTQSTIRPIRPVVIITIPPITSTKGTSIEIELGKRKLAITL